MRSGSVESVAEMSEAIKLFGRRIAVPETQAANEIGDRSGSGPVAEHGGGEDEKDSCQEAMAEEVKDLAAEDMEESDHSDAAGTSPRNDTKDSDDKESPADDKSTANLKPEQEQAEQKTRGQEKVIKKPDKILPCPRCNSMDTKFCYYNNYNVNQPRHFCKNCQRYWTAGGTMRNVPVGAGRRKNKHSSANYRHMMTLSEGMPSSQIDGPDSPQRHSARQFGGNRTVLKFGQEAQICDSMSNSLNIREQKRQGEISTATCSEIAKEPACSSSLAISNSLKQISLENAGQVMQNGISDPCGALLPMQSLHCYPNPPWAFQWGPVQNDIAAAASSGTVSTVVNGQETGNPNPMAWSLPLMMPAPAFVAPTIPVPLIPTSYWGCMVNWPAGTWNTPLTGPNGFQTLSSSMENYECSGIHSPRLGKHSRDAIPQGEEKVEKSLWVPKTLRIDDPEEAAKSSIWATLGIKHDQHEPFVKGGIFKSFQPDTNEKSLQPDATQIMHANPAALSRSQTFQEIT